MSKPIHRLIPLLIIAAISCPPLAAQTQKIYTPEELSRWTLVGIGTAEVDAAEKALRLFEGKDSKGITLVSPDRFEKNIVLRFSARPLQAKGVNIVMLSMSDKDTGGPAALPAQSDGAMGVFTTGAVADYMAAFHTAFHQPYSFIKRQPGDVTIAEAKDIAASEAWYEIEFGRRDSRLWLKVNGTVVCEGEDKDQTILNGGAVGLRLRGPGDGTYACLFRDVRIIHEAGAPAPSPGWYTEGDWAPGHRVRVEVANPLPAARQDSPIVITRGEFPDISFGEHEIFVVDPALPSQPDPSKAEAKRIGSGVTFKETNGHLIPYQLDDLDKDGVWDELVFMSGFQPLEIKTFYVYFGAGDRGMFEHQTHAELGNYGRRTVPWWESKTMGWKLWYPTDVDLYGKRQPMLVANHENTLNISGYTAGSEQGNDIMTVEDTFGAGGVCLFEDPAKPASPSRPRFSPTRGQGQLKDTRYAFDVVSNGPLRSTVRVRTMGWRTGRGEYELEQLYSADKGKSYSTVRVRFLKFEPAAPDVRLGCGIRKLTNESEFVREGGALMSLARDVDIFDPDVQKQFATRLLVKFLGTALVVKENYAPDYRSTAEFGGNHLLALPRTSDLAYEYLLAAGWSEGSVNKTAAEFKDHVRQVAREYNRPVEVVGVREEFKDGQAAAAPSAAAASVKVGVGEEIITPPVGVPMAGYARKGVSTGVHDDLYARSLVIEAADKTSVVMMTLGIINFGFEHQEKIRAKISAETGIPPDNILISCTHTHSGPDVGGAGPSYIELVIKRAAKSAVDAWRGRIPGRVGTGSAAVLELGRNDRRLGYGGLHPDPEVGLIKVEDARGKLLGVAFNYGCHPSTLSLHNLELTEDWPHYAIRDIKRAFGRNVWAAFFQSAQGDVKVGYTAELSAVGAEMPIRSFWYAEVKGRQMAAAVAGALPGIATSANPDIRAASGFVDLPLRTTYPMTAKDAEAWSATARTNLAAAEAKGAELGRRVLDNYKVDVFLSGLAVDCSRWVEKNPNPSPVRAKQYAARLGDGVFVTFPCEVFSEIGLQVKQRSPLDKTFVFGVAGGMGGYIPTAEEYKEGGYTALMTRFSPKCEDILINSSLELIKRVEGK
jgi:neutral ceramidase